MRRTLSQWAKSRPRTGSRFAGLSEGQKAKVAERILRNPEMSLSKLSGFLNVSSRTAQKIAATYKHLKPSLTEIRRLGKNVAYRNLGEHIRRNQNKEYSAAWVADKFKVDEKTASTLLDLVSMRLAREGISFKRTLTAEEHKWVGNFERQLIARKLAGTPDTTISKLAKELSMPERRVARIVGKYKLRMHRNVIEALRSASVYDSLKKHVKEKNDKPHSTIGVVKKFRASREVANISLDKLAREGIPFKRTLTVEEQKWIDQFERRMITEALLRDPKIHLGKLAKNLNRSYSTVRKKAGKIRRELGLPSGRRGPM